MFITFEGGEGSGKTTTILQIKAALEKLNRTVILTREPGGTPIAEQIREVILRKENVAMDGRTEALLYAAARRQHLVEKVWPALARNEIVICDRFLDSSLAYQGYARGLGIDEILGINLFATEQTYPSLTFFFDLTPEEGLARIHKNHQREINRLDLEKLEFHARVREGYLLLAERYPERIVKIDASQAVDKVVADCLRAIENRVSK